MKAGGAKKEEKWQWGGSSVRVVGGTPTTRKTNHNVTQVSYYWRAFNNRRRCRPSSIYKMISTALRRLNIYQRGRKFIEFTQTMSPVPDGITRNGEQKVRPCLIPCFFSFSLGQSPHRRVLGERAFPRLQLNPPFALRVPFLCRAIVGAGV